MTPTEHHTPRLFPDDAAVRRVGQGLLDHSLPRADWTHEAHLAACFWLVRERPDLDLRTEMPGIIRRYNEAVGGVNDGKQGYHETLTQFYLAEVRAFNSEGRTEALVEAVNRLLRSPRGARDWPLQFYTAERLFSVAARRYHLAPDRLDADSSGDA
jgi:hypothetical protein